MTHTDLIARLRVKDRPLMQQGDFSSIRLVIREAADALTAAQERIEALEGSLREADDELDHYYRAEYPLDHTIHRRNLKHLLENNPDRAALDATDNT